MPAREGVRRFVPIPDPPTKEVQVSDQPQALERSALERKDRSELMTIATAMGGKPGSRAKKADIIDMIFDLAGITPAEEAAGAPAAYEPAATAAATEPAATEAAAEGGPAPTEEEAPQEAAPALAREQRDRGDRRDRDAQRQGGGQANGQKPGGQQKDGQQKDGGQQRDGGQQKGQDGGQPRGGQQKGQGQKGQDQSGQQGQQGQGGDQDHDEDGEADAGNRRRRRRGRDRDRGQDEPLQGEPVEVEGLLDLRDEGYGFLRVNGFLPSKDDVYVSVKQTRQPRPWSAARRYNSAARRSFLRTPPPCRYMVARLACATASPCSAAWVSQYTASRGSFSTPAAT